MENKYSLSGEESLDIIRRMITTAKQELKDESFYFLLWGWLVFISCLVHYIMIQINSPYQGISWAVLMPLGGIITMVYGIKQDKKTRVKSYIDELMKYVLIAFLVSLFTVLIFMSKLGLNTYPMVMIIYGIWLFVSGGALKFRPLIIGGIVNWIMAVIAFFFNFEIQLLILATAVLLGYIIPGHLLKLRFMKNYSSNKSN
jgi:hypothetical protein